MRHFRNYKLFFPIFMKAYQLPEIGYASPQQKLIAWRKHNKFKSQRLLAEALSSRIKAEYAPDLPPQKTLIHQPDVSRAEEGFPGPFAKVTAAICRLYDLPDDYFGQITVSPQEFREQSVAYQSDLQTQLIECQQRLIAMLDTLENIHKRVAELTEENIALKARLGVAS